MSTEVWKSAKRKFHIKCLVKWETLSSAARSMRNHSVKQCHSTELVSESMQPRTNHARCNLLQIYYYGRSVKCRLRREHSGVPVHDKAENSTELVTTHTANAVTGNNVRWSHRTSTSRVMANRVSIVATSQCRLISEMP